MPPAKFLAPLRAVKAHEAARLRILLVVDTDDRLGVTWGRDGDNVKMVLEAALESNGSPIASRLTSSRASR